MKSRSQLRHLTCHILAGFTLASTLTGCAADIMRGYLGRAPEEVMAKYGPPSTSAICQTVGVPISGWRPV